MVRLVHFSDIHITASPLGWRLGDWFNKRLPGWVNLRYFGRGHRFRHADLVLDTLVSDLRERRPDRVIFSGDATAMGFEVEFARAAAMLKLEHPDMPPGLAVPGNHDYYTIRSAQAGMFERYFQAWQRGERVDNAIYPFAQKVASADGKAVWVVGVNSCTGNRWMWDAAGSVDAAQLGRLRRLLDRLEPGPRILVTHYPVCLASGHRERPAHGLRNLPELVEVAARGGVGLWLHGHRHGRYHLPCPPLAPFPAICAGSATQSGLWSYNDCTIDQGRVEVRQRVYDDRERRFRDADTFTLDLPRS